MYLNYCTEGNKVLGSNTFFFSTTRQILFCVHGQENRAIHTTCFCSFRIDYGVLLQGMGDGRLDGVNCTITTMNKTQYTLQLHGRELAAAIPKLRQRKLMSWRLPPRISKRLLRSLCRQFGTTRGEGVKADKGGFGVANSLFALERGKMDSAGRRMYKYTRSIERGGYHATCIWCCDMSVFECLDLVRPSVSLWPSARGS